jgi:hypothetical protein
MNAHREKASWDFGDGTLLLLIMEYDLDEYPHISRCQMWVSYLESASGYYQEIGNFKRSSESPIGIAETIRDFYRLFNEIDVKKTIRSLSKITSEPTKTLVCSLLIKRGHVKLEDLPNDYEQFRCLTFPTPIAGGCKTAEGRSKQPIGLDEKEEHVDNK